MAQTLSPPLPAIVRFTLSGTPDNVTRVNLPRGCNYITVQCITNAGKLSTDQALADDDPVGTNYVTLAADTLYELKVSDDDLFISVASGTASTVCEIVAEKDPN